MTYFLYSGKLQQGRECGVDGKEASHLLARRLKAGERFNFQDSEGRRFVCEVIGANKKAFIIKPLGLVIAPPEPKIQIILYQSVVAGQALDYILQKSTELGAAKIILFNSERTATELSRDKFKQKFIRWQKILWEAAKQCDRAKPPTLEFLENLDEVMLLTKNFDKVFVCDVSGEKFKVKSQLSKVALVVGPEGGLTFKELEKLENLSNSQLVSLGPLLLRADTAALAAQAILRNIFE